MRVRVMSKINFSFPKIGPVIRTTLAIQVLFALLFPDPAFAYVDPGSGSVIVTTILGIFAAIGYTFRKAFYNLRSKLFGGKKPENNRSLDD